MKTVFYSLLLISIIFNAGESLKCYKCDSFSHPACDDRFLTSSNERPTECTVGMEEPLPLTKDTPGEFLCVKVEFLNATQAAGTLRSCTLQGDETCSIVTNLVEGQGGKVTFCETCATEQCNSAPTLVLSLAVVSSALLAALRVL